MNETTARGGQRQVAVGVPADRPSEFDLIVRCQIVASGRHGRRPLHSFCRPSGAWLRGYSLSRGLRPWLLTFAPPEREQTSASFTPHRKARAERQESPGGTKDSSPGRKPRVRVASHIQSPGGATEVRVRRVGRVANPRPSRGAARLAPVQENHPGQTNPNSWHVVGGVAVFCIAAAFASVAFAQRGNDGAEKGLSAQQRGDDAPPTVRFEFIDVYIDSGDVPLAAYQFELTDAAESVKIVGIEGGEHQAFTAPPYYDPKALKNNRVIIAALSTADDLPTGKTRVATVHVQVEVDVKPEISINLEAAGDVQGNEINAEVTFVYSGENGTNNEE